MKIIRDNQEIELTAKEILSAYYVQKKEFIKEDIRQRMNDEFEDRTYLLNQKDFEDIVETVYLDYDNKGGDCNIDYNSQLCSFISKYLN